MLSPPRILPQACAADFIGSLVMMDATKIREAAERDADDAEHEPAEQGEPEPGAEATAAAEAPEPEPEPEPENGEPEPAPEPEPAAQGISEKELEARFKKAEQATARYTKAIEGALGELAEDLTDCPLCPSVHKGFVNVNDAGRIPDEIAAVVRMFLGDTLEAEYVASPTTRECPDCSGLGKVSSGSKVPNYETLTCASCKGHGFVPPPGPVTAPPPGEPPAAPGAEGNGYHAPAEDVDPWGSPRLLDSGLENPNYGRMPQFKSATLP